MGKERERERARERGVRAYSARDRERERERESAREGVRACTWYKRKKERASGKEIKYST